MKQTRDRIGRGMVPDRVRRDRGGVLAATLTVFISFLLVLALGEGFLHLYGDRWLPAWGWRWAESPYRDGAFPVREQVDQYGLRGPRIEFDDDDFVVVLVGDSYVEAGAQPFEDMPGQLLENLLRTEFGMSSARVFSVASAGWGQDQEYLALQAWLAEHRADLVINWLTPVNDFWENTFIERSVTPEAGRLKPSWWLDADGRLHGPRQRYSQIRLLDLFWRAWASLRSDQPAAWLAAREMRRWNTRLPDARRPVAAPGVCPAHEVAEGEMIAAVRSGVTALTVVSPEDVSAARTHFAPFSVPRSAREDYQIRLTRRLLQQMADLSRRHGAVFVAFYPRGSDIDRALARVQCVREQATGQLYTVDIADPLRPLTEPAPDFAVLAPTMVSSGPTTLSSHDWHLNRDGNILALRELARSLRERGWLAAHPGGTNVSVPDASPDVVAVASRSLQSGANAPR